MGAFGESVVRAICQVRSVRACICRNQETEGIGGFGRDGRQHRHRGTVRLNAKYRVCGLQCQVRSLKIGVIAFYSLVQLVLDLKIAGTISGTPKSCFVVQMNLTRTPGPGDAAYQSAPIPIKSNSASQNNKRLRAVTGASRAVIRKFFPQARNRRTQVTLTIGALWMVGVAERMVVERSSQRGRSQPGALNAEPTLESRGCSNSVQSRGGQ